MPATTASLGFSITVTNVTGVPFTADFRLNVKKRIAKIIYLETPPPDSVRLAYSGSKEINAKNTLFIGDRSDRLYPNSKDRMTIERILPGNTTGVEHQELLCTQRFAERSGTRVPMYYKHVLPAHIDMDSVRILDKNLTALSSDHWVVELIKEYDETTGDPVSPTNYLYAYVFNSQESYFDETTGEYETFYIQYADAFNTVNTVLLSNEPAYTKATLDDIWYVTSELKPWCFAYILEKIPSGYFVRMPSDPSYPTMAIRYTARAKIEVLPPALTDDISLWLPRVTNGSFAWQYGVSPSMWTYYYEIPEFSTQSFNPYEPYKMTDRAKGTKIASNLLKLPHERILQNGFARYLSIVIEENNKVIYAITLDPSLVGSRYEDIDGNYVQNEDGDYIVWSDEEILSVDSWSGIVQMGIGLKDYWGIYCGYTYEETHFEFSRLNMNPVFDREAHKQIRILYLVPRAAPNNNLSQTASIEYLKVGPGGTIEETSQDGADGNPNIAFDAQRGDANAYSVSGVIGLHYCWRASTSITNDFTVDAGYSIPVSSTEKFPMRGWVRFLKDDSVAAPWVYVRYDKKTESALVISEDDGCYPETGFSYTLPEDGAEIEVVNFLDQYTTSSYPAASDELLHYGLSPLLPNMFGQYFVLGELSINPPHGIHDVVLLDVREDGGGVIPELYDEAKALNPEVQWYYDYLKYNGQPTPGNAVVVVKVPEKLLRTFTKEQIEEIVENNIPYGVKPIIKYYGYQPQILSIATMSKTELLVCWEPMGAEFVYDVWYASSPKGPWKKHNDVRLTDASLGTYDKNCYLIDGLDPGKVYYTKITCQDKYEAYWCSYASYNSVEGGQSREDDPPEYPFGNTVAFKIDASHA